MIIIKNSWFPFGRYATINLFGILFTKINITQKIKNHESIHSVQILECLIIALIFILLLTIIFNISAWWMLLSVPAFYIFYGIEYIIIRLCNIKDKQSQIYHEVSFEEEAYNNEYNLTYLKERKILSWIKYLSVHSND